jgi:hypothetical protein
MKPKSTQKRRRLVAEVLVSLSIRELELELVRRAIARTHVAINEQEIALSNLRRKYAAQRAEIAKQVQLIEGGAS